MGKVLYLVAGLFFWAGMAGAEFYQYKDEAGRIVFTDDLSRLPEKEREKVLRFQSEKAPGEVQPAGAEDGEGRGEEEGLENREGEPDSVTGIPAPEEEVARLESERKAIAEEHVRLQALQKSLTAKVPGLARADAETVAAHNREVEAFDAARAAYEKRRAKYNEDVQTFNQRILEKEKAGDQQSGEGDAP